MYLRPRRERKFLSFTLRALERFAGCVVVISHDRLFLDRIATHILAFEGESKVTFFDGDLSEYEEWCKQTLGDAAARPHQITYRKLTKQAQPRPAMLQASQCGKTAFSGFVGQTRSRRARQTPPETGRSGQVSPKEAAG